MVEAEEVHALASVSQVHDPRLVRFEFEAQLGQDRGERLKGAFGLLLGVADRQQIIGLCRVSCYAEDASGSPVVAGVGGEKLGIIR